MGLRYISNDDGETVMYDSVTMWAFGPVFSSEMGAERFCDYAEHMGVKDGDVRQLSNEDLYTLWEQYAKEVENPYG